MEYNFTYAQKDFDNFAKDLFFKKHFMLNRLKNNFVIILIIALLEGFYFGTTFKLSWFNTLEPSTFLFVMVVYYIFMFLCSFLGFYILILVFQYFLDGKQTYKMLDGLSKEYTLQLSEDKIHIKVKNGATSEFEWNLVKEIYNTKHSYTIRIGEKQCIFIPKRIFEKDEDANNCWNIIKEYSKK